MLVTADSPSCCDTVETPDRPLNCLEDNMRKWMILGTGAAVGFAIGIVIGNAFDASRLVLKILVVGGGALGAGIAAGIAVMAGWIKESDLS
jgi:hypothetical protein